MRIGELAATAGTTTKTLRFYEKSGLLPPAERAANGYRDYGPAALSRLDFIRRGRAAGLTLAQIREVIDIREGGDAPCNHVHQLLTARLADIDRQIADLQVLRATLVRQRDHAERRIRPPAPRTRSVATCEVPFDDCHRPGQEAMGYAVGGGDSLGLTSDPRQATLTTPR